MRLPMPHRIKSGVTPLILGVKRRPRLIYVACTRICSASATTTCFGGVFHKDLPSPVTSRVRLISADISRIIEFVRIGRNAPFADILLARLVVGNFVLTSIVIFCGYSSGGMDARILDIGPEA